jgi:hypothetical protein
MKITVTPNPPPAGAEPFTPELKFPNQVRKNFELVGPTGQHIVSVPTESEARELLRNNKFFLVPHSQTNAVPS